MFGSIDILKKKMTDKERKILSRFNLKKKDPICDKLSGSPVPNNYADWPGVFTLLDQDEGSLTRIQKICDVRDYLKGMISFVKAVAVARYQLNTR